LNPARKSIPAAPILNAINCVVIYFVGLSKFELAEYIAVIPINNKYNIDI
jgi:hypothetical protein